MSGQNRIERLDPRCHRLRGPVGDRRRIWKSMLDKCANSGISVGHGSARIARTYPESKKGTALSRRKFCWEVYNETANILGLEYELPSPEIPPHRKSTTLQ